jgi:hypothetical protein
MLRELLTLVVPLVLPTALYLAWIGLVRSRRLAPVPAWRGLPWAWLAATGVALTAVVLFVVTVHFGTPVPGGAYVPPHLENGRVVPGHFKPAP